MKKYFRNIPILLAIFLVWVVLYQIKSTAFALSFDCASVTDVSETECNTLVGIYNDADGINWTDNTNWLGSWDSTLDTVCDREGIICDDGVIIQLTLSNNNLSGAVNLSGLTGLISIGLWVNWLSNINLDGLINLEHLDVCYNQLSSINLSWLDSLQFLFLPWNQLLNIDLIWLIDLIDIYLGVNQLSNIDLTWLINLELLNLEWNNLLSVDLSWLQNLQEVYLNRNQLSYVNFLWLTGLTKIILDENQISNIELDNLTNLQELNLRENQLADINLSWLTNLVILYLCDNELLNIDLTGLINLQQLELCQNQLSSINLSWLNNLQQLFLGTNQFTDVSLFWLTSLQYLSLGDNPLLWINLSWLNNLQQLYLMWSNLSSIDLFWLTGLIKLDLRYNQLSDINFSWLNDLQEVALDNNYLTTLPDNLSNLGDLVRLDIQNNCISTWSFSSSLNNFLNSIDTVIWWNQSVNCPSNSNNGGWWWGWYSIPPVTWTIATWWVHSTWVSLVGNILWSSFSTEFNNAYLYAYSIGITTMPTIQEANIEWNLIRSHMAKMMVNYAIKVMSGTINTWRQCNFDDIQDQSQEMRTYIQLACQLGIMWVGMQSFIPDWIVTRAEFGTVLSRILYGDRYNNWELYYSNHLKILKDNWIMVNNDPNLKELRWYIMLMLMRAQK